MKHAKAREIIGRILFVSLLLSIGFSAIRFINAPSEVPEGLEHIKVKSDYLLMLLQCAMGLAVMLLPSMIERRWRLCITNVIHILYYVFLYCAVFLGEVFEFFYLIPHWDTILHAFSGAMLSALGFVLVDILNRDSHVKVSMSPFFVSLFAFCFALAMGALWEIYEYSFDALLGLNMQKHTTEAGVALTGTAALGDTMQDFIIDALSALVIAVLGFFTNRKKQESQP
jgi:hypothetical protein